MVKAIKSIIVLIALVVTGMGVAYGLTGNDLPALTDAERDRLQAENQANRFVKLTDGTVHFDVAGLEGAPTVLLIHGFSTPSFVWDDIVDPLTAAGLRVVRFDNYGRGLSDRPQGPYDAALTDRLILELLDQTTDGAPVHLVGYSMGGASATIFASRHPERVASLSLIAPAGLGGATGTLTTSLMTKPVVGDWIMRVLGPRLITGRSKDAEAAARNPQKFRAKFDRQMAYKGYFNALLSSLRHYPLTGARAHYRQVATHGIPTMAIWGEADAIVPFTDAEQLQQVIPGAKLHSFPGKTHYITFAQPDLVSPLLSNFITTHLASSNAPALP